MKKVIVFKTAQKHIFEAAVQYLEQNEVEIEMGYLGNSKPSLNFSMEYIVPYNGFLNVKKIPLEIKNQIKSEKYQAVCFPYSKFGIESYRNLVNIASKLRINKIILFSEFGIEPTKTIWQLKLYMMSAYLIYIFSLIFLLPATFFTLLSVRLKKVSFYSLLPKFKMEIDVIHGTTNIMYKNLSYRILSSKEIKIGCIARFDPIKGHTYLINAFAELCKKHKSVKLFLIGSGPELPRIKEQVKRLEIADKVEFEGLQTNVENYLLECDFFVLPSLNEAMPIVLFEVMSAGKPIIATKTGSIPKIIKDRKNGLLVNCGSTTELANSMDFIIKNKSLAQSIGESAYLDFVQYFSPEIFSKKYNDYYRSVAKKDKTSLDVIVTTTFDLETGGVKNYIDLLKNSLEKEDINITLMTISSIPYPLRSLIFKFAFIFERIFMVPRIFQSNIIRKWVLRFLIIKRIIRKRPDIIHVHDVLAFQSLKKLCKLFSIPLILTKHGDLTKEIILQNDLSEDSFISRYFLNQEILAYNETNYLIVVDEESKYRIQKREYRT